MVTPAGEISLGASVTVPEGFQKRLSGNRDAGDVEITHSEGWGSKLAKHELLLFIPLHEDSKAGKSYVNQFTEIQQE